MIVTNLHKEPVALDTVLHRDLRLKNELNAIPKLAPFTSFMVSVSEFADAALSFPILFVRAAPDALGSDTVAPVAVFGLKPGENLFAIDGGTSGTPATCPRCCAPTRSRWPASRAPTAGPWCSTTPGKACRAPKACRCSTSKGEASELLNGVHKFVQDLETDLERTRQACAALLEMKLLKPMRFDATLANGEALSVDGFMTADEEAINKLPDAQIAQMYRNGLLGLLQIHIGVAEQHAPPAGSPHHPGTRRTRRQRPDRPGRRRRGTRRPSRSSTPRAPCAGGFHPSRIDNCAAAGLSRAATAPSTAASNVALGPIAVRLSTSWPRASNTGTDTALTPGRATPSMHGDAVGAHALDLAVERRAQAEAAARARARGARARGRGREAGLVGERLLHRASRRAERGEQAAGRGVGDAHHRAVAHRHVHRRRRLGDAHQRRPAMAPDGDRHGVAGGARQLVDALGGQAHRVVLLQADQAHLQRERAQAVAAALGLALDQAQLDEAHQVGVGLAGGHVGGGGEVLQRAAAGRGAPAPAAGGRRPRCSGCRANRSRAAGWGLGGRGHGGQGDWTRSGATLSMIAP